MGLLDFAGALMQQGFNAHNQNIQNQFNAAQADLNRQFQSQEAQIARDWQEQQYNQYSSPQAMVRQYQEAGLNPALMYGQNLQSSTGSSPMPSGSQASGSAPSIGMPTGNIAEAISSLAKLKQDINESKSREAANYAQADLSSSQIQLNKQSINESQSRISKLIEETKNEQEKRGLIVAQKLLANIDSQLKSGQIETISYENMRHKFEREFYNKFGFYPESSVVKASLGVLGEATRNIEYGLNKLFNFGKDLFK